MTFHRISNVELIGPTSIGFRLIDSEETRTGPIVISPANFITDFSVFLTAVRAAGETRPVDPDSLNRSWEEARLALRQRLIEEDPWGQPPLPPPDQEGAVVAGEDRLDAIRAERERSAH